MTVVKLGEGCVVALILKLIQIFQTLRKQQPRMNKHKHKNESNSDITPLSRKDTATNFKSEELLSPEPLGSEIH